MKRASAVSGVNPASFIRVDLGALRYNLRQVARRLQPGTRLLVVVKSEAYGHGMVPVAKEVQKTRLAACLGVSGAWEAFRLRKAGIRMPILILGVVHPKDVREVVRLNITSTVSSVDEARALDRAAKTQKRRAKVHVELDTGMGRLGVWCAEAIWFLNKVHELKHVDLEGVFTHFPSADDDDPKFSRNQIEIFDKAVDIASELFGRPFKYVHIANSMGLLTYLDAHFTLVRPGITVYGLNPTGRELPVKLRPVLSLRSHVAFLKSVEKGRSISYARTYITDKATRIATVPIGYSGGYPFHASNKASVLIRGKRYPVVGRVTMDHIMVDVGDGLVKRWDEVTLIGRSGGEEIAAEELARLTNTIPYQIVTALSQNLPRIYVG